MTSGLLEKSRARGATALRGGRWHPSPYLVFGALFWVVMVLAYWRVPMCCDFGQHAAVVERLKANLLHPRHPMADLPGAGSPYYSPYAVAQGLFARLTGLAGWEVVKLTGPVNLLILLTGIGRFVRTLTPHRWAPVFALYLMVVLWGTRMAWWSGYLGLMSMTGNLAYPSTFAIGLTFWIWAWTARLVRSESTPLRQYAGVGALTGLTLLIHPITAVGTVIGMAALALSGRATHPQPDPDTGTGTQTGTGNKYRHLRTWGLALVTAAVVAAIWPYYSVFSLVGDQSVDAIHRQLYHEMPARFWLAAVLGLPALCLRWNRDHRDPLVLMFALDLVVIAYGWVTGHYTYGRILGLTLVPLQFALAVELTAARPWSRARRTLGVAAVAGALVGFLTIQAGAVVPRALDPVGFDQPPRWPTYTWAARYIAPGDVVLTDGYRPTRSLPAYGPNLVAPAWPDPALDERERSRRLSAVHTYLAPTSNRAQREAIARLYDVRWLLLTRGQRLPPEAVVVAWSRRTGEVLARVNGGVPRKA
ncbi:hypothetical protein ACIQNU_00175 [Streptomyces sp. NPDC091292]|uniref:hypothetical protein n=1 Tax=Streptomyces sp. NPDC091292 TaxID=3365991 RepID=UPI0037FE63E5